MGEEELRAVREPLETGWLTQGPKVAAFEKAFASRHKARYATAVSSCTTGLHLALTALGVGPGHEVIVPSFTWVATANAALYCGAVPVLADVDPETYNLDPGSVAEKATPRTRAVIAVHLFGLCADMDAIAQAAPKIPVIEDAACACGATYKDRPAGTLGLAGAFSFHPRKIITTGEGGMVTTNDADLAEKINMLRNHGASVSEEQRHLGPKPHLMPEFNVLGYNYRMTDLQGAVGLAQLAKLDGFIRERGKWAEFYKERLSEVPWLKPPKVPDWAGHSFQSFVCVVDEEKAPLSRDAIMDALWEKGIATRPGTHAVHMLGLYRERYGLRPEDLPVSRRLDKSTMAIPLHNRMTKQDYETVVGAILELS